MSSPLSANPTLNNTATNIQVANQLEGPGVTISNFSVITGTSQQFGIFTGGNSSVTPGAQLSIEDGVFLITGNASETGVTDWEGGAGGTLNAVKGPNDAGGISSDLGLTYTDPQLTSIDAGAIYDPIILQMQAVPVGNYLKISFVFASDEYPEFVCTVYNDPFGMFIKPASDPDIPANWTNIAVIPGTSTPIAVNTINGGVCGSYNDGTPAILSNTSYYVDNGNGSTPSNNTNLQYDGMTIPFTVEAPVTAGVTYDVKIAVADAGDGSWDGALFLKWLSSSNFSADADLELDLQASNTAPSVGDTVIFTLTVDNKGQDSASGIQTSFPLPSGFTHASDTSGGNYNPVTGIWTIPGSLAALTGSTSIQITTTASGSGAISAFAEISTANASDVDSIPGNGTQLPKEDDEDTVTLTLPTAPVIGPQRCMTPVNFIQNGAFDEGLNGFPATGGWGTFGTHPDVQNPTAAPTGSAAIAYPTNSLGTAVHNSNDSANDTLSIAPAIVASSTFFDQQLHIWFDTAWRHAGGGGSKASTLKVSIDGTNYYQITTIGGEGSGNATGVVLNGAMVGENSASTWFNSGGGGTYSQWGRVHLIIPYTGSGSPDISFVMNGQGVASDDFLIDQIYIPMCFPDYGDAPDSYGTDQVAGNTASELVGPSHVIDTSIYMGSAAPDPDLGGQPSTDATGDDTNGVNDEDGVFTDAALSSGLQGASLKRDESTTLHIPVTGSGNLSAWIDWNGDGDFADLGEHIASAVAGSDETLVISASVPISANVGTTYARFRFSSDAAANTATGAASDGEVEDYQITITDDPTPPTGTAPGHCTTTWTLDGGVYKSTTAQGLTITASATAAAGAIWSFVPNDALNASGVFSDPSLNGAASLSTIFFWDTTPEDGRLANAADDAQTGVLTFDFGMAVNDPVIHIDRIGGSGGSTAATPMTKSNSSQITPNAANASATFTSLAGTSHFEVTSNTIQRTPNETLQDMGSSGSSGTDSSLYTAMGSVQINGEYSQVSLDLIGVGVEGAAADGIEFVVCAKAMDYGDAPERYHTTQANNGAAHVVSDQVYLGNIKPDADTDGQPSVAANNDGADEDGISTFAALNTADRTYAATVTVTNTTTEVATLVAWIDFDGNDRFDADEAAIRTIPAGTNTSSITLQWSDIPVDSQVGDTYLRLRLTTDTLTNREPMGVKGEGEVEDYPISITTAGVSVSGRVFRDTNVNGVNDASEAGISQLPVVLYNTATLSCVSTRTNGEGDYQFTGVAPGNYQVYEASRHKVPVPVDCGPAFAKDPSGYRSTTDNVRLAFSVAANDITDQDFGDVKPPVFEPDHHNQVLPGNVLFYAHRFSTPTQGSVSFSSVSSGNTSAGWSSLIYQDSNCNGRLDGAEGNAAMSGTQSSASTWVSDTVNVTAGSRVCLINKVYAPANVAANDAYTQRITANFDYGNAIAGTQALKVQDVTTAKQVQAPTTPQTPEVVATPATPSQPAQNATPNVPATDTTPEVPSTPYTPETDSTPAQAPVAATPVVPEVGPSQLELRKTVRNITKGSAETDTINSADPGDTLEYRIYYRNSGTGPLTDLVVNDVVPPYTTLTGSTHCGILVSGMSCIASPLGLDGELSWVFSGALSGGSGSSVSYQLTIDN